MIPVKEKQGTDVSGVPVSAQGSSYATAIPCSKTKYESTYVKMSNASTTEGKYYKQYVTSAATSGEAGRFVNSIYNVAAANQYGVHNTLAFNTSGSITGLGVVARHTLEPAAGTMSNGTYACQQSEIYSPELSSMAGVTELSMYRVVNDGNATAMAIVDDKAFLFSIQGFTAGSGSMFQSGTTLGTTGVGTLKIKIGSTTGYINVVNAQAS